MADDWDLYAVVRGCRSAIAAAETSSAPAAAGSAATATATTTTSSRDSSLSSWVGSAYKEEENDSFSFLQPRANGFQELHQLFIPFIPTTTSSTSTPTVTVTTATTAAASTTTSGCGIYPNSSPFPDFAAAGSINSSPASPPPPASPHASNLRPHFTAEASSTSGFQRFPDKKHVQQPQQQQQHDQNPSTQAGAQTPRSRKRHGI